MIPAREAPLAGEKLASPFLDLLPISGVVVSVLDQENRLTRVHASDETAARLEEIHFDLGEGPLFDCVGRAIPVLIPDVSASEGWPIYFSQPAAAVGAIFIFPLALGAVCIGAVLCYRSTPGELDASAIETGVALGRAIAGPALRRAIVVADNEEPDGQLPIEVRREVHQATGMVLLQLDTTATDAFASMRAYAFSRGVSLREVARDVVTRRLNFSALEE
ncbi:GAF and ANTAR domain-containing protein [Glaciihabitans sp. dw_435]|uniref:GAF and ANTAR domain-containing protein n=1 Tax=Glaciihabitans sp. dw_435 TaxID=2720081 RepID=UPI001BD539C7|nr:GAF and ANTAR domain-containing protein [Glaciihabitans sp. dw_435]